MTCRPVVKFEVGDFVLVAGEELSSNEKLCLRWRGLHVIVKTLSNCDYFQDRACVACSRGNMCCNNVINRVKHILLA